MKHTKDQLVVHPTLGLGKVLDVQGDGVTVFFKDTIDRPRRTIRVSMVPLEIPKNQSDPWLDSIDVAAIHEGKLERYLTHRAAIAKFLRVFPEGFSDPKYIGDGIEGGDRPRNFRDHFEFLFELQSALNLYRLRSANPTQIAGATKTNEQTFPFP